MTHPSKTKGNKFEREIVNDARAAGLEAQRAYASNGKALGHAEEVDLVAAGCRIQAKIRKALPAYLVPSDGVDAVVFRADRGGTLVLVRWEDFRDRLEGGW